MKSDAEKLWHSAGVSDRESKFRSSRGFTWVGLPTVFIFHPIPWSIIVRYNRTTYSPSWLHGEHNSDGSCVCAPCLSGIYTYSKYKSLGYSPYVLRERPQPCNPMYLNYLVFSLFFFFQSFCLPFLYPFRDVLLTNISYKYPKNLSWQVVFLQGVWSTYA